MRIFLGLVLMITSGLLAIYNIRRNERKEITGPTLTLIFSAFVGAALLMNLNFVLLGFDSEQLNQKVEEAKIAKNDAILAKELAEKALKETKEVYALNLLRTGMLPSDESILKDRELARKMLKEAYGDQYLKRLKELNEQQLLPSNFKP